MYRLDVITDIGVFVLEIDPANYGIGDTKDPAAAAALLRAIKESVAESEWFNGWTPFEDPNQDPVSVISIESGAQIKAFRLYEYNPVGINGFSADATPTLTATPYPFTCFGEYLENKLKITGVAFKTPTTEYLLPVLVNNQPATDYMKPAALSQQIQLCKEAEGVAPTEYLIIIPDVWLDYPVAIEYIADYVKEAEPTTKVEGTGKAKAWDGWNDK